jgi:hypothetical protein
MSLDEAYYARLTKEFEEAKEFANRAQQRVDEIKQLLNDAVINHGYTDDKGHLWLTVGDMQLKRERRVSTSFNENMAEGWAKASGKWDLVKEVREFVSEEKMLGLAWEDPTLKEQMPEFYNQRETWAFKVVAKKDYSDD